MVLLLRTSTGSVSEVQLLDRLGQVLVASQAKPDAVSDDPLKLGNEPVP